MPLTWWLQADTHFNEDDPFQQNLALTLQVFAEEKKEEDCMVTVTMHKEIQPEINVIFEKQIDNWLNAGMVKTLIFTTGKGDILLRQLFATSATSFVEAQTAGVNLKKQLQDGYYDQFALHGGPDFLHVNMLAMNDFSMPVLRTDIDKALVLLIATEDSPRYAEIKGQYIKDCIFHLQDYRTKEVHRQLELFYENNPLLASNDPLIASKPETWEINEVPDIDLLELFE